MLDTLKNTANAGNCCKLAKLEDAIGGTGDAGNAGAGCKLLLKALNYN